MKKFFALLLALSMVLSLVACGSTKELSDLSVITKADRQLYVGKNGGKDCVAANDVIYNFSPNK